MAAGTAWPDRARIKAGFKRSWKTYDMTRRDWRDPCWWLVEDGGGYERIRNDGDAIGLLVTPYRKRLSLCCVVHPWGVYRFQGLLWLTRITKLFRDLLARRVECGKHLRRLWRDEGGSI